MLNEVAVSTNVNVTSEIGKLKKVLMHRPDDGIEKVTPSRAVDLLYEDIVYLPKMKEEHDFFTSALACFVGKENVYDVQTLLTETISNPTARAEIIDSVSKHEKTDPLILKDLPLDLLARTLITGILPDKSSLFNPLPNLIFTRDIGVVINDHLLTAIAFKEARSRETILCRNIFNYHPIFSALANTGKIIDLSKINPTLSVEGGDVMIFAKNHLIIASSERTSQEAIFELCEILFQKNVVAEITQVGLPKERYCMHLDTIFTRISKNECVAFEPLIIKDKRMPAFHYSNSVKNPDQFPSLGSLLEDLYPGMEFIHCGNGVFPFDEREQWTDGCNLFAVKDGVAFTYDRNVKTNKALQERGYSVLEAAEFIWSCKKGVIDPDVLQKTIITIPSSELSRARGGTHCMTMPLLRENDG